MSQDVSRKELPTEGRKGGNLEKAEKAKEATPEELCGPYSGTKKVVPEIPKRTYPRRNLET